jgi:site-specific recombinase XerD
MSRTQSRTQTFPLAPLVRSFFEDHLTCQRNVSRNTIHSYRDTIKLLLQDAAGRLHKPAAQLLVADVDDEMVLQFLADLEKRRGNSIQTRNHRLVGLRRLFDYIAWREPLVLEHCRKILAIPRKRGAALPEVGYLERHEVAAVLQAAAAPGRDYALLLFMYNTGARVQEVADARGSWLFLHAPCKVELLGKGSKRRTCPLWDSTAVQLKGLLAGRGQDDPLFANRRGEPLSRSGIAGIVRRYAAKAAAVTPSLRGRRVTPHTFRHTTAMHLLQSGVEVNVIRSWLGHVSISTTSRYIEIDLAMKAKALETCKVGPRRRPAGSWRKPDVLTWLESL